MHTASDSAPRPRSFHFGFHEPRIRLDHGDLELLLNLLQERAFKKRHRATRRRRFSCGHLHPATRVAGHVP